MGITFSRQRPDAGAEGKGSTPSPPRTRPAARREASRGLDPGARADKKGPDPRVVALKLLAQLDDGPPRLAGAGTGQALPLRRMSESDVNPPERRGLAHWRVASLPDAGACTPSPQGTPRESGPLPEWIKDEDSPLGLMEFKHSARAASRSVQLPKPQAGQEAGARSDSVLLAPDEGAKRRALERLERLQQAAVRMTPVKDEKANRSADDLSLMRPDSGPLSPLALPSVDFSSLSPAQAAQWLLDRLHEAHVTVVDERVSRRLPQELIAHHKVLTPEQLQPMGHVLGQLVRAEAKDAAVEARYRPLARLLAPLCALASRAWAPEQLASLLAGLRSAFPAADRLADLQFQRAINAALEQGMPLGHCVAMACGLYHGSNDRPGRAFSPVRLDQQDWSSPNEHIAKVLNWGRRLVLDAPSIYLSEARVPGDRRFEWLMSALAIPGVASNQQAFLTQGRSLEAAHEAMTIAQREALAAMVPSVQSSATSPRVETKSRDAALVVARQVR